MEGLKLGMLTNQNIPKSEYVIENWINHSRLEDQFLC